MEWAAFWYVRLLTKRLKLLRKQQMSSTSSHEFARMDDKYEKNALVNSTGARCSERGLLVLQRSPIDFDSPVFIFFLYQEEWLPVAIRFKISSLFH